MSWYRRLVESFGRKRDASREDVERLQLLLANPSVEGRADAVKKLGDTRHPLAAKYLLNAMTDREHERVLLAVLDAAPGFRETASKEAVSMLARALGDASLKVKYQALRVAEGFSDEELRRHRAFMTALRRLRRPDLPVPRDLHARLLKRLEHK